LHNRERKRGPGIRFRAITRNPPGKEYAVTVTVENVETVENAGHKDTRRAPRTRADALRNRERIVAAAREVLVEFGPDAPLDEIARRAGIGNATLYRHFPDRHALVHDVVVSVIVRIADHAEEAARGSDPFTALCAFAHAAVEERVGALCGVVSCGYAPHSEALGAEHERLQSALDALMERARAAGQLRPGVGTDDLMIALSQLTRPLPGSHCPGIDAAAHRHVHLFLDGLRAVHATDAPELPGPDAPPTGSRPRRTEAPCTSA
jgi:AcrR family transcriptional regulator